MESSLREQKDHAKLFPRTMFPVKSGVECLLPKHKEHRLKVYRRTFQSWRSGHPQPGSLDDLASTIYPEIVGEKAKETIRIWVVACSSGEEVYSLAITLPEFLGARASSLRIQLFGTDINEKGITIADSGTGMDTETLRKLYEPFFTTKGETGTGLGMLVAAQLVERLQGDLRVSSTTRPGRSGTAFSLFLPLELASREIVAKQLVDPRRGSFSRHCAVNR